MLQSLKELIVVLVIAATIFHFAKPIALRFSAEGDFARRRNVWFVLTVTSFLSPNFWIFALIAAPLLIWATRKDTNPVALYLLMLFVIPQISVDIPVAGINRLFSLDIYRLLSFCVLIPAAWRLRYTKNTNRIRGLQLMDVLLLAYGVLQASLYVPYESPTSTLRRSFLFLLDVYVPYFAVSRCSSSRRLITEALAAFCLACAVMAPMAVFESLRHWLLYVDITARWSHDPTAGFYLFRGNTLRAQVSAGHALALGYLLAIGFGFWLCLQSQTKSLSSRMAVALLLWAGLLAAYSRGPWMGAIAIYFVFAALSPRAASTLFKAIGVAAIVAAIVGLSPLGERIISVLPFMGGSVDSGSILYREQLAERSWQLFQQHPFFGDVFVLSKMGDLRQGQGIIDLVNTYVQVGLFTGIIGLSLFLSFILCGLFKAYRMAKRTLNTDPGLATLGISLVACIVGTLLMIATCSFVLGYQELFYVLAALSSAYAGLGRTRQPHMATYTALQRPQPRNRPAFTRMNQPTERH